jgi:hypothetical protein
MNHQASNGQATTQQPAVDNWAKKFLVGWSKEKFNSLYNLGFSSLAM